MNNYAISLIRTWVPIIVGAVASWLLARGLKLDAQTQAGLIAGLTALLSGGYYAIVRGLETKFPWMGALLGHRATPVYVPPAPKAKA